MKIGGWAPHELHEHEADEVARDQAEGVRLAYVAATRARDLLVVPALGDGPWEGGWLGPLNRRAVSADRRRGANRPRAAEVSGVQVEGLGAGAAQRRARECVDGLSWPAHIRGRGYSVVWWDPGALKLGETPPFGVRREELIVKDVPERRHRRRRTAYDGWRLARADALARGAVPSIVLDTVRGRAAAGSGAFPAGLPERPIAILDLSKNGSDVERPGGAAFGALVHAVLARIPLDATKDAIEGLALVEARLLGLDDGDARAAASTVAGVLAHEFFVRVSEANRRGACRREMPVTLKVPDGPLIEGVVDLAFEENGTWTVVDYKTDRNIRGDEEEYRRQIAIYAAAIAQATGAATSGVLLVV